MTRKQDEDRRKVALHRYNERRAKEAKRLSMYGNRGGTNMTAKDGVRKNVQSMQGIEKEIVKLIKSYRNKAASVYRNPDLPDAGKAKRAVAAREEAREELEALRETLASSHETVKAGVVEMARKHDEAADRTSAAHESRISRAWARTRRLLDSGQNALAVANDAAERGDAPTLHALFDEAPAYFTAAGKREEGEAVRAKARELRGVVEGGLLGEALAAEHVASETADWADSTLRDASDELERGVPAKRLWLQGGDIPDLGENMDVVNRIESDSKTHASAIKAGA